MGTNCVPLSRPYTVKFFGNTFGIHAVFIRYLNALGIGALWIKFGNFGKMNSCLRGDKKQQRRRRRLLRCGCSWTRFLCFQGQSTVVVTDYKFMSIPLTNRDISKIWSTSWVFWMLVCTTPSVVVLLLFWQLRHIVWNDKKDKTLRLSKSRLRVHHTLSRLV